MNRRTAKAIHEITNITFWMENPNWSSGNAAFDLICKGMQKLPFSTHEAQRRTFFDTNRLLAVNGETVVAVDAKDEAKVDKFMFRYPRKMSLETYADSARSEINAITGYLAGIALPTTVAIQPADILKHVRRLPLVVTQNQPRLDLQLHTQLDLGKLVQEAPSKQLDQTARDLEKLAKGAQKLLTDFEYLPDIAHSSGNLRRNVEDGAITLIDVMPFYANGSRLIGDRPPNIITHLQDSVAEYEAFAGSYGA